MKRLFIISLFLISLNVYSQNDRFNIKFCPLSLIDGLSFPTIQGGFEIRLTDRLAWYNEFGVKYRKGSFELTDTSFIKSSGFKTKSELRYYLQKKIGEEKISERMNGFYVSTNIFYIQDFHNSDIGYYKDKDSSIITSDYFSVRKNVLGMNLAFGYQQRIAKHFLIDLYAGIGIRFRIIHDFHREYNPMKDSIYRPMDITFQGIKSGIDIMEGISCVPNLTIGYRICFN